jgi:ABC-type dipeptide/oligopeptide/nickel transport system ATPase subunit
MKQLTIENLYFIVHPKSKIELVILRDINFTLDKGNVLGISGESGAGKTTLVKIISGQLAPSRGRVLHMNGNGKSSSVQLLFQNTGDIINPFRRVFDVITEAAEIRLKDKAASQIEAQRILEMLQMDNSLWNSKGYELSGGQQQRTALGRLLAVNPELLILDEPFAAQDIESQLNLLNILLEVKKEFNLTVICISHNLKILRKFADNMIILKEGSVVEAGKTNELFENPTHPYTKLLMKAEDYKLSKRGSGPDDP